MFSSKCSAQNVLLNLFRTFWAEHFELNILSWTNCSAQNVQLKCSALNVLNILSRTFWACLQILLLKMLSSICSEHFKQNILSWAFWAEHFELNILSWTFWAQHLKLNILSRIIFKQLKMFCSKCSSQSVQNI